MKECVYDNDWKVFRNESEECIAGQTKLYQHNALTKKRFDAICAAGGKANQGTDDRAKLLHNSGLWAVENEIAIFAEKYALYNKCRQAQDYLQRAIGFIECATWQKREEQGKRLERIEDRLTEKQNALLGKLESARKKKLDKSFTANKELNERLLNDFAQQNHISKSDVDLVWIVSGGSVAAMQSWVNKKIHEMWNKWWQRAREKTEEFWAKAINDYKKTCIKIANESDALTDEEKKFMEQFILACPGLRSPKISPDVHSLVEYKSFLFWKWKEFKAKKCAEAMNEAINKAVEESTQSYASAVQKEVDRWAKDFRSGLTEKLADFNPGLRQLNEDLRLCREQLKQLEANQKLLEDGGQEIENLFKFDDECEKQ